MTELTNARHKVGDEVYLNPNTNWDIDDITNPLDIKGIVDSYSSPVVSEIEGYWVGVEWGEIGHTNTYESTDNDLLTPQEYHSSKED